MSNLINYNDGEIEVAISIKEDTIWLSQKQIAELFDKDVRTINDHIKAIYKNEELYENSTIRKFRIVQKEGDREVARDISHYNLDMIISVGYRVSSYKATKFRQWATSILKEYITQGYAINTHKITEHRLTNLENDMQFVKSKIKNDELQINQGIFYNGQIYDAYAFVNDLLKSAKSEVTLCDNYIDDTIFTLFSKYPKIKFTIYTHTISKSLKLDYEKYKKQYKNIDLKDLGNKVFAFSKLNIDALSIMEKLR